MRTRPSQSIEDIGSEVEGGTTTTMASAGKSSLGLSSRPSLGESHVDATRPAAKRTDPVSNFPNTCTDDPVDQLALIKWLHDEAKAVKADDAEVPIHLWNRFIARDREVDEELTKALEVIRNFALRKYRRKLTRDCVEHVQKIYGERWAERETENE